MSKFIAVFSTRGAQYYDTSIGRLAAQVCDRDNCGKAAREAVSAWISYLRECKDSK